MRYLFIVNPAAGQGKAAWTRFLQLWKDPRGVEARLTERRGHASDLAREAAGRGFERVVAVGGDGTLSEVVHGLLSAGPLPKGLALAHLPAGSGCDFARHVRLPRRPQDWPGYLEAGRVARLDAGRVSWREDGAARERYFVNIAMAGIAGDIVRTMERTGKPLGGTLSYLAVSIGHLLAARPRPVTLRRDGRAAPAADYHLLAVANTSTTGGGMRIAPDADPADGWLDFVGVPAMTKARLLWSFPKIYEGTHLGVPGIESGRLRALEADSPVPVPLNIDGEPIGSLPARFEILPASLPVLLP